MMYVLQVLTGRETEICGKLRRAGITAYCPQERRQIRRGGRWQEQLYTLYPSYLFIQVNDVIRVYYAIRKENGVLYWLGATKGAPEPTSCGWPGTARCRPARRYGGRTVSWTSPAGR